MGKHDYLKEKNVAELAQEEERLRKELFDIEFKHSTRQLTNTMEIRTTRRAIARVVTLKNQLTAQNAGATRTA